MNITVLQDLDGEWEAWVGLDGEDPMRSLCGFIVGLGRSRDAAVADAVTALEQALGQLREPA